MAPGSQDNLLRPLLPYKGNEGSENLLDGSTKDARTLKLSVIPSKDPPTSITHPGESFWWSCSKRGTEKWVPGRKLDSLGIVFKQKTDKFLSPKVRAVKRFEPGVMDPSKPGHTVMLRLLNISSRRPDLFVKFHGWYEDKPGGSVFLAMEYFRDGDLAKYKAVDCGSNPMEQGVVANITKQLLKGIAYLHKEGLISLGLKPEHILISDKRSLSIRIANFGISTGRPPLGDSSYCDRYKAPELLGLLEDEAITSAVDLWSLGCIVHELLVGYTPFIIAPKDYKEVPDVFVDSVFTSEGDWKDPPGVRDILPEICNGTKPFEYQAMQDVGYKTTDRAIRFLKKLFPVKPAQRISAAEALKNLWVFTARELSSQLQQIGVGVDYARVEAFLASYDKNDYIMYGTGLISVLLTENMRQDIGMLVFKSIGLNFLILTHMLLDVYRESQMSGGLHKPVLEYFRVEPRVPGVIERSIKFQSFLQRAASCGHIDMVKLLLSRGVSKVNEPHVRSYHNDKVKQIGRTALQAAAENGHVEVVKLLLEHGADVNDKPCIQAGRTALQAAVQGGHHLVVKILLDSGANIDAPRAEFGGQTAMSAARFKGDSRMIDLLLEYGGKHWLNTGPEREASKLEDELNDASLAVRELAIV